MWSQLSNKYKVFARPFSLILTLTLVFLSLVVAPSAGATSLTSSEQDKIDELKQESEALDSKIAAANDQIDALKGDAAKQDQYAQELQTQIDNIQAQIDNLTQSINLLNDQIDAKNDETLETETDRRSRAEDL